MMEPFLAAVAAVEKRQRYNALRERVLSVCAQRCELLAAFRSNEIDVISFIGASISLACSAVDIVEDSNGLDWEQLRELDATLIDNGWVRDAELFTNVENFFRSADVRIVDLMRTWRAIQTDTMTNSVRPGVALHRADAWGKELRIFIADAMMCGAASKEMDVIEAQLREHGYEGASWRVIAEWPDKGGGH